MPFNSIVVVDQRGLNEWPWWAKDIELKFNTIIEYIDQYSMFWETSYPPRLLSYLTMSNSVGVIQETRMWLSFASTLIHTWVFGFLFFFACVCFGSCFFCLSSFCVCTNVPDVSYKKYLHTTYIEDVLSINNTTFGHYLHRIYSLCVENRGVTLCSPMIISSCLFLIRHPQFY